VIFSSDETLEDRIISLTLGRKVRIKSLHTRLSSEEPVSLRAIYKAVDKLIEARVLLKAGKQVMVDEEWARRVGERLRPPPIPAPSAGEQLLYSFTSIEHLDAFWKSTVLPIEESMPNAETFLYSPHNFWAYIPDRKESEESYYRHFTGLNRGFFTIGGDSDADRGFKKQYQSEYLQIDTRDVASLRRTDHITVIGSLIITVRLLKNTAKCIDDLYVSGKEMEDFLPELLAVCAAPGKIKFTLENTPAKAKALRKVLARSFYFLQG
jgi:hypothetical protein